MRPHPRHLKRIGSLLRNGKTVWVRKPREPWGCAEGGRRARDMPCIDLLPIFCLFIFFLIVVFTSRFLSETFHQATGDTFGEKISERNTVWKSLSDEEKEVRWFFPLIFKQIHCDLTLLVVCRITPNGPPKVHLVSGPREQHSMKGRYRRMLRRR